MSTVLPLILPQPGTSPPAPRCWKPVAEHQQKGNLRAMYRLERHPWHFLRAENNLDFREVARDVIRQTP